MKTLFFLVLIAGLIYPLSFIKSSEVLQKKNYLIAYVFMISIALLYLIINHFVNGVGDVYFISLLTLVVTVNIFRLIKKRKNI